MRFLHLQTKPAAAAAAIAPAAAIASPTPAAAPAEVIPGGHGLPTRAVDDRDDDRFIPGVTDSTTGVLRMLEERRAARDDASLSNGGGSGVELDATALAGSAAAAIAAAFALVAVSRRRRVTT